eukprot:1883127-Prymnesium_polylepis.1
MRQAKGGTMLPHLDLVDRLVCHSALASAAASLVRQIATCREGVEHSDNNEGVKPQDPVQTS